MKRVSLLAGTAGVAPAAMMKLSRYSRLEAGGPRETMSSEHMRRREYVPRSNLRRE
jgi:hypothetical protein